MENADPKREWLSEQLHSILGSNQVYFRPPASVKMRYDAIVYDLSRLTKTAADNMAYGLYDRYMITYISFRPKREIIERLMNLPYCSFDREYVGENLHHNVFYIYV